MVQNRTTRRKNSSQGRPEPGADGGELALLRTIRSRAAALSRVSRGSRIRLGIGDDCALLLPAADEELAITTDLSLEGRHFRRDWHPPESVGHRTLARGLSDLAAMGARPVGAFLSLGLPRELTLGQRGKPAWVERFLNGLLALATECKVPLAGGDLAESPVAVADIVLIGAVARSKALLRSGARPGDRIYVTGSLGGSATEFARLSATPKSFARHTHADARSPHLYPQPRIAQGIRLRERGLASAAMDLSDGLSTDLWHICEESGVGAVIEAAKLPVAAGATLRMALDGGEDYELLFTAPESARVPKQIAGVPLTEIGSILRQRRGQPRVALQTEQGLELLEPHGWEHFSRR